VGLVIRNIERSLTIVERQKNCLLEIMFGGFSRKRSYWASYFREFAAVESCFSNPNRAQSNLNGGSEEEKYQ
jgi:hypothetical protein